MLDALRNSLRSPPQLAALAAVFAFLGAVTPVLWVAVTGVVGLSGGATGYAVAGFMAWLVVLAFVGAAVGRFVPALFAYRDLIDLSAFVLLGAAVLWAFFGGPVVADINRIRQAMSGLAGTGAGQAFSPSIGFSVTPNIGLLFVVLAPVMLFIARRHRPAV